MRFAIFAALAALTAALAAATPPFRPSDYYREHEFKAHNASADFVSIAACCYSVSFLRTQLTSVRSIARERAPRIHNLKIACGQRAHGYGPCKPTIDLHTHSEETLMTKRDSLGRAEYADEGARYTRAFVRFGEATCPILWTAKKSTLAALANSNV